MPMTGHPPRSVWRPSPAGGSRACDTVARRLKLLKTRVADLYQKFSESEKFSGG